MSRLRFRATAKTEFAEGASSVRNAVRDPVASCPEPSPPLADARRRLPPLADIVQVSLGLHGKGTAWMDDVRIEQVGLDVPLTQVDHRPSTLATGDLEQSGKSLEAWYLAGSARSHYEAVVDASEKHGGKQSARLAPRVRAGHDAVRPSPYATTADSRARSTAPIGWFMSGGARRRAQGVQAHRRPHRARQG